jgi:hypothetical protein
MKIHKTNGDVLPFALAILAYAVHLKMIAKRMIQGVVSITEKTFGLKYDVEKVAHISGVMEEEAVGNGGNGLGLDLFSVSNTDPVMGFTEGTSWSGHGVRSKVKTMIELLGDPVVTSSAKMGGIQKEWILVLDCGNVVTLYDSESYREHDPEDSISWKIGAHAPMISVKAEHILQMALDKNSARSVVDGNAFPSKISPVDDDDKPRDDNDAQIDDVYPEEPEQNPADSRAGIVGEAVKRKQEGQA